MIVFFCPIDLPKVLENAALVGNEKQDKLVLVGGRELHIWDGLPNQNIYR